MTHPGAEQHAVAFGAAAGRETRVRLRSFLTRAGITGVVEHDAVIALGELVANGVDHGSPCADGRLHVGWEVDDTTLVITVRDGGGPTTPRVVQAGPEDLRGRGMMMVDALTASWEVRRNGGTLVRAVISIDPAEVAATTR